MKSLCISLGLALACGAQFSAPRACQADPVLKGLARFRTLGRDPVYAPVILRVAAGGKPRLENRGGVAVVPCRTVTIVHADGPQVLGTEGANAPVLDFRIQRPTKRGFVQDRFDADLGRVRGGADVVILGLRRADPQAPYRPALNTTGFGLDPILLFPDKDALAKWEAALETYALVGAVRTIDQALWSEIVAIEPPEVRLAVLRDALAATYKTGLRRRETPMVRSERVRLILGAMGRDLTPGRWVRLHRHLDLWESDEEVLGASLRKSDLWVAAAHGGDETIALHALSIAVSPGHAKHGERLAPALVGAYLGRAGPVVPHGLQMCAEIAALVSKRATVESAGTLDPLVRGLLARRPTEQDEVYRTAYWTLALELCRRLGDVRYAVAKRPEGEPLRDQVRAAAEARRDGDAVRALAALLAG